MLKTRVRRAFERAAPAYAGAAEIQRRVVDGLDQRLDGSVSTLNILDAGCGTGFGIDVLARRWPHARIVGVDIAAGMLAQRPQSRSAAVCADVEALPLADASVDLYWSSLTLQWCDLGRALAEARRVLRDDGTIAFATLGSDTFNEVRAAFAGVDRYPHTIGFLAQDAIEAALRENGFGSVNLSRDKLSARYPDLKSLLRSIRRVGAGEVGGERRRGLLGRHAWATVEAQYARFRRGADCPLTYDVIYVTARA